MSGYNSNFLLQEGKTKMRQFHQEQDAARLARAARPVQPESIKIAVQKMVNFFKPLLPKKDHPQPQPLAKTATESM